MARPKRPQDEFEQEDFAAPAGPATLRDGSGGAVAQPSPVDVVPKITDGKQILAGLLGISIEDVAALTRAKEEANTFALAAQAEQYAQQMKSRLEQEHIRKWAGKSSQEKTQEVVDKAWSGEPGTTPYVVRLAKNKHAPGVPESITLTIPAHSREEAQGRYLSVCGIRSTDHFVVAEPVPQKDGGNAA